MIDVESIQALDPELLDGIVKEFETGWQREKVELEIRRQRLQQIRKEVTWMDGVGVPVLNVDPTSFHYWGQRLGYECWGDRGFIKEYRRDNPDAAIHASSPHIRTGYGSGIVHAQPSYSSVKERKIYS